MNRWLAAVLAILCIFEGAVWLVAGQQTSKLYPDTDTQAKVKSLSSKDVAFLSFRGLRLGHFHENELKVYDPKMIERFLTALKNAEAPDARFNNRTNTLTIYLKGSKQPDPLVFAFEGIGPAGSFGSDFLTALQELGKWQVAELKRAISLPGAKLTINRSIGTDSVNIPSSELPKWVSVLNKLDASHFDYTNREVGWQGEITVSVKAQNPRQFVFIGKALPDELTALYQTN